MKNDYTIDPKDVEMAGSVDILNEKRIQAISQLQREEENVYRSAIAKRFGEFNEHNAKKCSLRMAGSIKQLMCGEDILCEIYPFEQAAFPEQPTTNKITLTLKYRIF
ncbi:hypothetical protein AHX64_20450 [Salmonella enterica subsp. enterica serovar Montevideo]|nr:hypothetical protein [Salmonella enterica]EBV4312670.1 hypothetical protein [Salmonella enterica subsp. enterica serovar Livingstone]EBZ6683739.1 hypothetical protein [Salmonella enterica subsp. enterica serovar Mbandaka]ECZ5462231.1 hypothetical protein [Salmonella enterica subsp. enterica serovar Montevideo]EDW2698444.1 hypothetical protein [Salmonella enterica subsp. enterica serovar Ohio]